MEKHILISVSPYVQKYYFNEEFQDLPNEIKETLRAKLGIIAEKTNAIISLGFYENGEIFIEERHDDLTFYDEIGTALRIKKFQSEEVELLRSIKMWYIIYKTPNGAMMRDVILLQSQGKSNREILEKLVEQYGKDSEDFVKVLLED